MALYPWRKDRPHYKMSGLNSVARKDDSGKVLASRQSAITLKSGEKLGCRQCIIGKMHYQALNKFAGSMAYSRTCVDRESLHAL